jgi:hypothetical protein
MAPNQLFVEDQQDPQGGGQRCPPMAGALQHDEEVAGEPRSE